MASFSELPTISAAEYLRRERESPFKSEYVDGVAFAMAGASPTHNLIVANLAGHLRELLRHGPCRVFGSDLKVCARSDFYYPDVTVICEKLAYLAGEMDVVTNPHLLVEVLSPSTSTYDRGHKLLTYQTIPTLQAYMLVEQLGPELELYQRQGGNWLYTRVQGLEGGVAIASLGVEVLLAEVYSKVEFR